MTRLDSVERAVADIGAGKAVVVIDDEDRENEGDLIFAAEKATPELVAFMVRYTSGYLCVPLDGDICDRLGLLPMYAVNQDKHGTAYTVTVSGNIPDCGNIKLPPTISLELKLHSTPLVPCSDTTS